MRQFIDGNGNDSTTAALAFLAANDQFRFVDLYVIGDLEDPFAVYLTNWESPLTWSLLPTPFQNTVIKRGQISSQVGLQVDSLSIVWSPQAGANGASVATATPYQLAQAGFYDNLPLRLWRGLLNTATGDLNTFGACAYFGGRIADSVVERGKITFTVQSFLDVINQKVPANVIESTNSLASYAGATPVLADGETALPRFSVVAPSSAVVITADCISPTAHKVYGSNKLRYGFLVFEKGTTLERLWSAIATNQNVVVSGIHYNQLTLYSQFPFPPTPGDTFYVSTQFPINQADGSYNGFPYVPAPETML